MLPLQGKRRVCVDGDDWRYSDFKGPGQSPGLEYVSPSGKGKKMKNVNTRSTLETLWAFDPEGVR